MATFQTLNDKQTIHHYVTPRTRKEAGIGDDELLAEDDAYCPEYCIVYLFAAIVCALVALVWWLR